jgi:hypothetical protein
LLSGIRIQEADGPRRCRPLVMAQADELLVRPPDIQQADVIASKVPA